MSQVNVNQIVDASGGVLAPISSVMRNRIINGAMVIDQRNAGASVTPTTDTYTLDRWVFATNVASKASVQQNAGSVTPPDGYKNYLGITSTSAYTTLGATDVFVIRQKIEGFNVADLGFGTANAKTVTLSFWVRSSLTGTFAGSLNNGAENRSYPFSYSIPVANTWTNIAITIAGDTAGTWLTTNGTGLEVGFSMGMGSTFSGTAGAWSGSALFSATGATSVVSTNGATFYITGVQLERGTQATSFEYRQYGQELALCQRYFQVIQPSTAFAAFATGTYYSSTYGEFTVPLKVKMRASPTGTASAANTFLTNGNVSLTPTSISAVANGDTDIIRANFAVASGGSAGSGLILLRNNTATAFLQFNAEL